MKTISPKVLKTQINRCYMAYDPKYPKDASVRVPAFKSYIEQTAGLKLDFIPRLDSTGRFAYELKQIEIVNEPKFTLWLVKWS